MTFELKEGDGYLNQDNENPEKFWGSYKLPKDMKKGEIFTKNNLRIVRPGLGLPPKYYDIIFGKKVNQDVKKGTALNWEFLNGDKYGIL